MKAKRSNESRPTRRPNASDADSSYITGEGLPLLGGATTAG